MYKDINGDGIIDMDDRRNRQRRPESEIPIRFEPECRLQRIRLFRSVPRTGRCESLLAKCNWQTLQPYVSATS